MHSAAFQLPYVSAAAVVSAAAAAALVRRPLCVWRGARADEAAAHAQHQWWPHRNIEQPCFNCLMSLLLLLLLLLT
jgi:hypothetical protein